MRLISKVPRSLLAVSVVVAFGGPAIALTVQSATAATTFSDGMPSQATTDLPAAVVAAGSGNQPASNFGAGWADWSNGAANRPYVTQLSVINGGTTSVIVPAGTGTVASSEAATAAGNLTTVVTPTNLCKTGQAAAQGSCYTTQNRVQITLGYGKGVGGGTNSIGTPPVGFNFLSPNLPTNVQIAPAITSASTIDMTVALNGLSSALRWTWVNGDLVYWQVTPSSTGTTVHLQFHPSLAPVVSGAGASGCTATPIGTCSVSAATADVLTASVMFSFDQTLDPSLAGAVFATQNAVFGFMQPGGTATAPTLGYEISSSHNKADGSTAESGTLEALIPSSTLLKLYTLMLADAPSVLKVTRDGDTGTNNPTTMTPWSVTSNGTDGLFVSVTGISFSVPDYVVSGSLPALVPRASLRKGKTTVKATIAACRTSNRCVASLYDLGSSTATTASTPTLVLKNKRLTGRAFSLVVRGTNLPKGDKYLLEVHSLKLKKVLASTIGTVS